MNNSKINILIVGATGHLGALVTKYALLRDNLNVSILIRDPEKNKQLVEQVEKADGRVIKGDLSNPESLKDVTKGIHTVVSAISSHDEGTLLKGQLSLLNDAVKNGAKRFLHSYFGTNNVHLSDQDKTLTMKYKETLREEVHKAPIAAIDLSIGAFIDTYFLIHSPKNGGLRYAGDINQKIDFTSYEDAAKYTVAVVSQENLSGTFVFVGQEASVKEVAEVYNKVRGTNVEPKNLGSVQEFEKHKNELKKDNNLNSLFAQIAYLYYSGLGKFPKSNNAEFPEVKPETLEEVIKRRPELNLN